MSSQASSSNVSPVDASGSTRRPMIKARKDKAASTGSSPPAPADKYYGQRDLAEFCEFIVTDMFCSAGPESAHVDSNPHISGENGKAPPALILFIAYALYRTRLPVSIVHHALFLLHRLKARYPSARGTSSSPHRLFLSALMLSSKIQMDDTYSNRSWAIVGGNFFALREVNQMERELFAFLEFNAVVSRGELDAYTQEIEADWSFVLKSRQGQQQLAAARTRSLPAGVEQPTIGKRRRSDTTYTEQAIEKAQALRHKRAADAAIALLQPCSTTAAKYRTQLDDRLVDGESQESSSCSSFVSSPSSDQFFNYHSSSSYATSPETSSPTSSKGPITPEEDETFSRFTDVSINPDSRTTSWQKYADNKEVLSGSFTYSAGGRVERVA